MNQVKVALEALLPAINNIDGGCTMCIYQFAWEANIWLEKAGVPYHYHFDKEASLEDYVTLADGNTSWPEG